MVSKGKPIQFAGKGVFYNLQIFILGLGIQETTATCLQNLCQYTNYFVSIAN
jgi:hypothetical protein